MNQLIHWKSLDLCGSIAGFIAAIRATWYSAAGHVIGPSFNAVTIITHNSHNSLSQQAR